MNSKSDSLPKIISATQNTQLEDTKVIFINTATDDKEWSAHIRLLNKWTEPDRYLRQIIQYARSGAFYPADMHVDLIKQIIEGMANKNICNALDRLCESKDSKGQLYVETILAVKKRYESLIINK